MPNIRSRIAALAAELQAGRFRCVTPYDQLDPLSQGLVDAVNTLRQQDKAELLEEMNRDGGNVTMDDLEWMLRALAVDY